MVEMWLHSFDDTTARCTACDMPFSEAVKTKRLCASRTLHTVVTSQLTPNDRIWQHIVDVARSGGAATKPEVAEEDLDFDIGECEPFPEE